MCKGVNNLDKPWDWSCLSKNKNITFDIVFNNLDKPWNWNSLSNNPNISLYIISNNLDKPWNWENLTDNLDNFKYKIIEMYECSLKIFSKINTYKN